MKDCKEGGGPDAGQGRESKEMVIATMVWSRRRERESKKKETQKPTVLGMIRSIFRFFLRRFSLLLSFPLPPPPSPFSHFPFLHYPATLSPFSASPHTHTMKFGDNLEDSINPQWKDSYVQYNALKKQLEEGLSKPVGWTERDEGIFGQTLDSDLTKVRKSRHMNGKHNAF